MSVDLVRVPLGENSQDTAVLLLAGIEATEGVEVHELRLDTSGEFGFVVPKAAAEAAGLGYVDYPDAVGPVGDTVQMGQERAPDPVVPADPTPLTQPVSADATDDDVAKAAAEREEEKKAPAKKAPAKRAPAKKAAAKRAPAKKAATKKAAAKSETKAV